MKAFDCKSCNKSLQGLSFEKKKILSAIGQFQT